MIGKEILRQGLVMVDLLDNFLNPLKVFLALASDLASSQVRDEWK